MDKKNRLKLIRKAYQDTRKKQRKLTPKAWQFVKELREENDYDADVVVEFRDEDVLEEIQLLSGKRRVNDFDTDWDNGRYYDSNTSAEMLYFRRPED